jgi:TolB-like protein
MRILQRGEFMFASSDSHKAPGRKWMFLLALIGSLCLSTGCLSQRLSTGKAAPRAERSGLAVIKFVNTTSHVDSGRFDPWEYGIPAMLTTDLEQTALFNIVDRARLKDILDEQQLQQSGLVDPTTAVTIGKLTAAHYILTGTFMVIGDDLSINAQVFCVEQGIQLGAISSAGKMDEFFMVEKDLFIKITQTLQVVVDDKKQAKIMRRVETRSVEASLKNYAGEMALFMAASMEKLGKIKDSIVLKDDARNNFKQALEFDPTYKRAKDNFSKLAMGVPMTL